MTEGQLQLVFRLPPSIDNWAVPRACVPHVLGMAAMQFARLVTLPIESLDDLFRGPRVSRLLLIYHPSPEGLLLHD